VGFDIPHQPCRLMVPGIAVDPFHFTISEIDPADFTFVIRFAGPHEMGTSGNK